MTSLSRRSTRAIGLAFVALFGSALVSAKADPTDITRILAPSGKLRAALYPGTPTSILPDPDGHPRAVGYESGKALAEKLHVPYEPVTYAENAEVQDAIKSGATDVAFTNASP